MFRFVKPAATIVLLGFAVCAQAQIYTWKDANGRTYYGDQPPPGVDARPAGTARANSVPAPAAATTAGASAPKANGPKTWQEKDQEFRQRQAESAEKTAKQQEANAKQQEKTAQCNELRRQLTAVESGARIGRTNSKGEMEVFDDAQRKTESQRLRGQIDHDCAG